MTAVIEAVILRLSDGESSLHLDLTHRPTLDALRASQATDLADT